MASKKVLILPIVVSIIIHALMLSAAGLVGMNTDDRLNDKAIIVDLQKKEDPKPGKVEDEKTDNSSPPVNPVEAAYDEIFTEDTISLESSDERYAPYLRKVKIKIEESWTYPRQAFEQKKEGISMVRFSLSKNGKLLRNMIVNSSGYDPLDRQALNAVRAAAPYEPFPNDINLSRLHILASFHYHILE